MSNFKLETYELVKDQVKLAHIFSNNEYSNGSIRDESKVDIKKLENILLKLDFKVKIHENLKRIKCLGELEKIADNDGKEASVILVIFLSHGSLNEIKMTDEKTITIKQIAETFNSKSSSFAGKPKIFLFQTCQGDQSAKSLKFDEKTDQTDPFMTDADEANEKTNNQFVDNETIVEEVEDTPSSVPSGSDMFMGFASSPGFVSYRSPIHGSRFIQTFTTIINDEIKNQEKTENIDFVSLMTKVAAEVAHMSGRSWPICLAAKAERNTSLKRGIGKGKMQMPWYLSTLTKKLEFEIPSKISKLAHK